jgi:hypothetical protein
MIPRPPVPSPAWRSLLPVLLVASQLVGAQPANEPLEDFVTTDGMVYAASEVDGVLYFGGSFRSVGSRTGSGVPVSFATGEAEAVFPRINGSVNVAIGDGRGGWFVGGTFTLVGGLIRSNLVHIRSDRTVDPDWSPTVAGGYVKSLVLSGDTLYLAGAFTHVNGQARNRAAALDAASGSVRDWDPDANAAVKSMVVSGMTVYLGGDFTNVGGQTRAYLAAVDASTGQATAWNPGVSGAFGATVSVEALLIAHGRLFVGGYFTGVGGQPRSMAASVDLPSGLVDAWDPGVDSVTLVAPTVFALAEDGNTIYLGGVFTTVGASSRVNLAAVDATTGLTTSWDAQADLGLSGGLPTASVSALAVYHEALFVGGILFNIGGQPRAFAAALDTTTGSATAWDPQPNMLATTFSGIGDTIYVGGLFGALASSPRTNLAAVDLRTRKVTPWNPTASANVWALLSVSNSIYLGGEFKFVSGLVRSNLAAVDLATGEVSDWAPNPNLYVLALASWRDRLYVGGGFTNIAGMARTNLAEIDLGTGLPTSWDAALNRAQVRTLAVQGDTLYAGGLINTARGQTRRRIAVFDLETGELTPWESGLPNSSGLNVEVVAPFGDRVYVGGRFQLVGGVSRTNFVALDATTAAVLPLVAHTDQPVTALAATSNQVFLGGNFTVVNGQKRSCLAALDVRSGQLTSWTPDSDFYVQKMFIFRDVLYPAGVFLRIGGQTSRGLAAYPLSLTAPPTIVEGSARQLADGRFGFQVYAPGAPQATVQVSTNLDFWQDLVGVTLVGGNAWFLDSEAPDHPRRFYRLSVP